MQAAVYVAIGVAVALVGHFLILWAKKGWSWGIAKLQAWWNKDKASLSSLQSLFTSLEGRVKALEQTSLGTAAKTAAPAAPAAGVVQSPNSNG